VSYCSGSLPFPFALSSLKDRAFQIEAGAHGFMNPLPPPLIPPFPGFSAHHPLLTLVHPFAACPPLALSLKESPNHRVFFSPFRHSYPSFSRSYSFLSRSPYRGLELPPPAAKPPPFENRFFPFPYYGSRRAEFPSPFPLYKRVSPPHPEGLSPDAVSI